MNKLRATMVQLLVACVPAGVHAQCGHSEGVDYCGPELIQLLSITSSSAIYVQLTTPLSPAPAGFGCTPVSGRYFVLPPAIRNFKQIYATLLSARVSGAPVTVVADPTQPTCTVLYVTL
jgi:hypothetical protein